MDHVDYASSINNGGKDLLNILDKIMQISRIKAGKEELRDHSFDLRVLMEDLKVFVAMRGMQVKNEFLPHAECRLLGDAERIRQLFTGLLLGMAADSGIKDIVVSIGTRPRGKSEIITGRMTAGKKKRECPQGSLGLPNSESEGASKVPGAGIHLALSHELDILSDLARQIENKNPDFVAFLNSAIKSYDYEVIFATLHLDLKT